MTAGWHQIQQSRFSPAESMKCKGSQPRQGKLWFPTSLRLIIPADDAYLPAPKIQTQKKTHPTRRTTQGWSEQKSNCMSRGSKATRVIPGEQGSSATRQRGPNTSISDTQRDTEQTAYLFQKDLQANISRTPKDVANIVPS